jgi:cell division protein FtsW (lipid II flippase)
MNLIAELTKYIMILLIGIYTFYSFQVLRYKNLRMQNLCYKVMTVIIFLLHFVGYFTLYLQLKSNKLLYLYAGQVVLFVMVLVVYRIVYERLNRLLIRHMLMLLTIGFTMITRLSYDKAVRQTIIVAFAFMVCVAIPGVIKYFNWLSRFGFTAIAAAIVFLALVLLVGRMSFGARNWLNIAGITVQPSEFVKLIYVFGIAAMFREGNGFGRVCLISVLAAANVLLLVCEKDLGGALIFFITYIFMLYVATSNSFYLFTGLVGGSVAAFLAYKAFNHVRVRVMAWQDPFKYIKKEGYQISQSLFAIGTGSWLGMGLNQGLPTLIPVATKDFIFSAIVEELGAFYGLCIVLIFINCFVIFINIAIEQQDMFYRLMAMGFSVLFSFQVILCIGGVIKFIPSTGVTLPLVSYGGSSAFSTIIMFMMLQGIYMRGKQRPSQRADRSRNG